MREFLISSEHELDMEQMAWLVEEGDQPFFPCSYIHFNDRIKLAFFTDGYVSAQEILPRMTLDEICALCKQLLTRTQYLESRSRISLEQVVWDAESIYINRETGVIRLIALPVKPAEKKSGEDTLIYRKRIYALLTELCSAAEGGDVMNRQIEHQQEEDPGNWEALKSVLDRRIPEEDEMIILRSAGREEPLEFRIGHGIFGIGSDPERADGVISSGEGVSPLHAIIGWNEISFFVTDLESENGTWLNDTKITPGTQVPFGKGSTLMFGKCRFEIV